MGELVGEGLWRWLLDVGCWHFNDTSTGLQCHFNVTSTALQQHFNGISIEKNNNKRNNISDFICMGQESHCLPYAGFLFYILAIFKGRRLQPSHHLLLIKNVKNLLVYMCFLDFFAHTDTFLHFWGIFSHLFGFLALFVLKKIMCHMSHVT